MAHSHRFIVLFAVVAAGSGCGPLGIPMVQRLEPAAQVQVEGMWNNMLTPVDRLDREVLLDTIVSFQLFQQGIDRLTMHCEKRFAGGHVVFQLNFDRDRPDADALEVDVYDTSGRRVRSEEFSGTEVLERWTLLYSRTEVAPETMPEGSADEPPLSEEDQAILEAHRQRRERILAATQPSR